MKNLSRRKFVTNVGLGIGATTLFPSYSFANFENKKLNIAICGLGRYGSLLSRSFVDSEYCNLAGIITGTPTKAEKWKKEYGIPQKNVYNYQNFDSIANNNDIDLVYVVLPNSMHKEYTIRAAEAGKHVIVEKPMALNEEECREMIEACKKAKVQLALGYRLHYEPHHQEIMRLGQEKVLGQIRLIEVSLGYNLGNISPSDWHFKKEMSGGGPLMNLGVYCVQAGRYTLGEEPSSVTAQFGPITKPDYYSEVEESITWQMNFASGAVCTSTSTNNCNIDRYFASAEQGFIELSPAVSYGPFKGRTNLGDMEFPVINQQASQMDGIAKVILDNKPLPDHIAGIEGWKDMKIIDAIYRAARTEKKVSLA